MKLISLNDFLKETLNEDKLERTYKISFLDKKYKKYKAKQKAGKVKIQIYISEHLRERFKERFIEGETYINPDSTKVGSITKYKDLPGWKKLSYKDFDRVLLSGINKCITKFKLNPGAYFIISKSTRLVLAMIVAKTDRPDLKAICLNTVLHTSMSSTIDIFKLGDQKYDSEMLVTEYVLYEDLFKDEELGLYLDAAVSSVTDFSHDVIFVD